MLNERKKAGFQGKQLKSGTRERLESVNNSATFQLFGSENNRKYFFLLPSLVTSGDPRIRPAFESFSMLSILVFSVPFFEFFLTVIGFCVLVIGFQTLTLVSLRGVKNGE